MNFDESFEANNFLRDILIYFPETDKYLSPTETDSRYPFPPGYLTDTYGLFISEVAIGDFKSAVGKIDFIKSTEAEKSIDKMIIDVSFDDQDLSILDIQLEKEMSGYYAMYLHPFMNLINPEDKEEVLDSYIKNLDENAIIKEKVIENESPELFGIKPLKFIINFNSEAFIEKAGQKYLIKIGELIGRQSELYQEKERILPVENEFQRSYIRTINLEIPKGYKIVNLKDISIKKSYSIDGKDLMSFESSYSLNDNILSIKADEFYKINHVETKVYEQYRSVINSAADFNKVTLILEPI